MYELLYEEILVTIRATSRVLVCGPDMQYIFLWTYGVVIT